MFTTRMSPKISVKPLATTKYSAAAVRPLSSVMRKSFGSLTAGPKLVPDGDEQHPDDREHDQRDRAALVCAALQTRRSRGDRTSACADSATPLAVGGPRAQAGCPIFATASRRDLRERRESSSGCISQRSTPRP